MHARFVTSLVAGLAGGFIVVASQAFSSSTTAWLAFAIAIGVIVLSGIPAAARDRGLVGLGLDAVSLLLGIWTVIASLVFTGTTVTWLSFAEGAAFVGLAVGSLIVNQVRLTHRAHAVAAASTVSTASSDVSRPAAVAA